MLLNFTIHGIFLSFSHKYNLIQPCYFMKAMLFAAGLGTRLKPITDTIPKALVPVGGRPLIDIVMQRLIDAGATEVVVNVHHFAEQVIEHLQKSNFDINIRISDERQALLDTGGGLRNAAKLFSNDGNPILIHNVDILSNANLRKFYEDNLSAEATLMVSQRPTQRFLLFDENNNLRGWTNVKTGEVRSPYANLPIEQMKKMAFSGIHCFSPRMFCFMQTWPPKFSIIDFYLSVCSQVEIKGYVQENLHLLDVGKISTLQEANSWMEAHC